ncbi:MAG: 30S ribosomal protein S12 methylthiotransferase RimO [Ignavibacteria bacterium]|nr:30S ribosomal protein S12 methylthiotransferase RimO [Ignavibacteria bacterium]
MKKQKVSVLTLGCSKNIVDSEILLGNLHSNGFELTERVENSKICIINTCGFIKPAVQENLEIILKVIQLKQKGKIEKIVVAGCLSQRFYENLRNEFPEVDLIVGVDQQREIVNFLKGEIELKKELLGERMLLTPRHYAYLKISEGCNRSCSFCAIPNIRGSLRSKTVEAIVDEAKQLAEQGVKELILISQDSSSYGIDIYEKPHLDFLLKSLAKVEAFQWIRLLYLYPIGITKKLLDVFEDNPNICKYFDIPLQHISDKVLKSMQRGTTSKTIFNTIEKIRAKFPSATIRSTFIVGYPNETEEDFEMLYQFLQTYKLDRVGVFTYSMEDGTKSFGLGDPIPEPIKIERKNVLMELQSRISLEKNREKVGKTIKVLIDERKNDTFVCRSEADAPEVDNTVIVKDRKNNLSIGDFVEVKVIAAKHYDLLGIIEK